jgi:hypothetical protein
MESIVASNRSADYRSSTCGEDMIMNVAVTQYHDPSVVFFEFWENN